MNNNYLNDLEFLNKVFTKRNRGVKIRITSLTFDEQFIESIEGKASGGSISVDGKSAVRRTCNLSLITNSVKLNNLAWGINTKFKLEIGVKNPCFEESDNVYPEYLWLPQGIFLITSFSQNIGASNNTISISGKDKMVLLNGEVSGHFGQTTVLDYIQTETGKEKYELKNIIYDMIYTLGNERPYNIIINDLEEQGLEMVKYTGSNKLYLQHYLSSEFVPQEGPNAYNLLDSLPPIAKMYEELIPNTPTTDIDWVVINNNTDYKDIVFSSFGDNTGQEKQTVFEYDGRYFYLYELKFGDIVGYQARPLTFNDDLIAQPGETITSVLDKIVNLFGGSYEYFYNLQGQFVFQQKKNFVDTSWQPYSYHIDEGIISVSQQDEFIYEFKDKSLIISMSINPSVDKIKNDYIICGETQNGSPIHLRYAIDTKPTIYNPIRDEARSITYSTTLNIREENNVETIPSEDKEEEVKVENGVNKVIWKWINLSPATQMIYKNKKTVYFSMSKKNYLKAVSENNNSRPLNTSDFVRINGQAYKIINIEKTLLGRYRIYLDNSAQNLESKIYRIQVQYRYDEESYSLIKEETPSNYSVMSKGVKTREITRTTQVVDWRELIYQMALDFDACGQEDAYIYRLKQANPWIKDGKTGYEQYYTDLMGFWPDVYRYLDDQGVKQVGWNQERIKDPNTLFYWLEFLEGDSNFNALSVKNIGDRTWVKNDKKISCLFEPAVPPILLYNSEEIPNTTLTYSPCQMGNLNTVLSRATFPQAAKTKMETELSNYTIFAKTLNITTIPIYFLEVNRKIKIQDYDNNINGQFLLNSFNISLNYNGTMSLSTSEIIEPLY